MDEELLEFRGPRLHPIIVIGGIILFLAFMGFVIHEVDRQATFNDAFKTYSIIIGWIILVFGWMGIPYSLDIIRDIKLGKIKSTKDTTMKIKIGIIIGVLSIILFIISYRILVK